MPFAPLISSTHRISLLTTDPDRMAWAVEALQADGLEVAIDSDGSNPKNLVPDLILFTVQEASRTERDMLRILKAHPLTAPVPVLFLCADTELARLWGTSQGGNTSNIRIEPLSPTELRTWVQASRVTYGLAFSDDLGHTSVHGTASDQALVRAAKNYLSTHHAQASVAENVASALAVDAARLADVFYATQGMALSEFLTQERIRNAQRLLLQSSLDVAAIAVAVGYATVVQFSAVFREFTGLTPGAYRRSSRVDSLTTQGVVRWSSV
ncbi:MAG: DNA-binding response regulator [Burkholderiaceae bacterium]|nr:DNA-binding response regulator [Burkholderiaceae bacterium]